MKRHPKRKRQAGQMVVEMVLMLTVMVGAAYFVSSQFRENNFIATLVSGPWKNLSGMIQNGVWRPSKEGMPMHPNANARWASPIGEPAR